jgi:hypothetical protein
MIRDLVLTTTAVTAGVLGVTAVPAVAAPRTHLVVSVVADAGWARAVTLDCSPAGGGHPKAAKACAALKDAGGKPNRLERHHDACTQEFAPVDAAIDGKWKGRTVRWTRHFANTCQLIRATGVVFRF